MPLAFVVKSGSKILARFSGGMQDRCRHVERQRAVAFGGGDRQRAGAAHRLVAFGETLNSTWPTAPRSTLSAGSGVVY